MSAFYHTLMKYFTYLKLFMDSIVWYQIQIKYDYHLQTVAFIGHKVTQAASPAFAFQFSRPAALHTTCESNALLTRTMLSPLMKT
jgi:hypothetical protein